ncbi:hypothetical protein KKF34_11675 [Myxococcota bacterium]|nr:hypothetical protein [Myxococcota bacterium]MBU1381516.1 hypothetical protein [Myxococcota bacterium]MBU1497523.1 hypothetical protein [Myxococcota bacterium]
MKIFLFLFLAISVGGCTGKSGNTAKKISVGSFEGSFLMSEDLPGYKKTNMDTSDSAGTESERKKAGILKSQSRVWIKSDMIADSRALFETESQAKEYYSSSTSRGKKEFTKTRECPVKGMTCMVFSGEIQSPDKQTVIAGSSCLFRHETLVGRIFIATKKTSVNLDEERIDNLCRKAAAKIMRK